MHVTKRVMGMNMDGWRRRQRPKDCVTLEKGEENAITANRGELEEDDVLRRPQIRWEKHQSDHTNTLVLDIDLKYREESWTYI